jgi:hypothetical protein
VSINHTEEPSYPAETVNKLLGYLRDRGILSLESVFSFLLFWP